MNVDELSWKILKLLQQNARSSNAEIGRQVGLTSPAVAERIKKMEDIGIIKSYTANLNHHLLGYQLKGVISIKVFMGRLKPFLSKVKSFNEVTNCYRITGNENIIMEVILKDQLHLERFIDKLITYGETKTNIVLSKIVDHNVITSS